MDNIHGLKKISFAIFIIAYLLSIPFFGLYTTNPDLDASWLNVYKWLLDKHCNFGIDIIYTYGPLAGYILPTYDSDYFFIPIFVNIGLTVFFILQFIYTAMSIENHMQNKKYLFSLLVGIYIFCISFPYADVMYYSIILCSFICMRVSCYKPTLLVIFQLFLLAALGLDKFSFLSAISLLFLISIFFGILRRKYRRQMLLLSIFLAISVILWIFTGQSIVNIPIYVSNYLNMALAYNSVMCANSLDGWQIFACAAMLLLLLFAFYTFRNCHKISFGVNSEETSSCKFEIKIFILLILWVSFKYGMGRHDLHQNAFWEFTMLVSLLIPSVFYNTYNTLILKRTAFLVYVISLLCLISGVLIEIQYGYNLIELMSSKTRANYTMLSQESLSEYRQELEKEQTDINRKEASLPAFADIIQKDTVDVYNFRQNYALLNSFNYKPRPVFQSHMSFTKKLMEKNQQSILTNPSQFIIFNQETIDNRLGTMDDNLWLAEVINNYDLVSSERNLLLLRKKDNFQKVNRYMIAEGIVDFNDEIIVPHDEAKRSSISLNIEQTILGKIVSMLWKPPIIELELVTDEGNVFTKRIIPSMTKTPVYIDGIIDNNNDVINLVNGTIKDKVYKIKVKKAFMYNWFFDHNIKYVFYMEEIHNHWSLTQ